MVVVGNGQLQNPDGNMRQAMEDRAGGMIWFGRASGDPKGHLEAVLLLIQYNKYETLPYYYCTP